MDKFGAYADCDADTARALFKERFGYAPDGVIDAGPVLLAGPIRSGSGLHAPLLRGTQALLPLGLGDGGNGNGRRPGDLLRRVEAGRRPMTAETARQLALKFGGDV